MVVEAHKRTNEGNNFKFTAAAAFVKETATTSLPREEGESESEDWEEEAVVPGFSSTDC